MIIVLFWLSSYHKWTMGWFIVSLWSKYNSLIIWRMIISFWHWFCLCFWSGWSWRCLAGQGVPYRKKHGEKTTVYNSNEGFRTRLSKLKWSCRKVVEKISVPNSSSLQPECKIYSKSMVLLNKIGLDPTRTVWVSRWQFPWFSSSSEDGCSSLFHLHKHTYT